MFSSGLVSFSFGLITFSFFLISFSLSSCFCEVSEGTNDLIFGFDDLIFDGSVLLMIHVSEIGKHIKCTERISHKTFWLNTLWQCLVIMDQIVSIEVDIEPPSIKVFELNVSGEVGEPFGLFWASTLGFCCGTGTEES